MTDRWRVQARHGLLEWCVLLLIAQAPRYGYELVSILSRWPVLAASEGTLYPLLRRLQRDGLVTTQWQESRDGAPRKYYHLTPASRAELATRTATWTELVSAVAELRQLDAPRDQSSA
jgi:PadR family transcriptional regulator PadR